MSSTATTIRTIDQVPGKIVDGITWEFPAIIGTNAHGKKTIWKIIVRAVKETGGPPDSQTKFEFQTITSDMLDNRKLPGSIFGYIDVESGLIGGKIKETVPTIVKVGKNLRKANETNTFRQALRDALGKYNKQLRTASATAPTEDGSFVPLLPMLAKVYEPDKMNINFDKSFLQRKYNGVRAIATLVNVKGTDEVVMYSRTGKIYPGFLPHKEELLPILKKFLVEKGQNLYLDGEIYKHGMALQTLSGNARKGDDKIPVSYMVYDCFCNKGDEKALTFPQRFEIIKQIFTAKFTWCQLVETVPAVSRENVDKFYKQALLDGYEGAMLRRDEPYRHSVNGYHSTNILKIKSTLDEEFEIVGWTTGTMGKAAGAFMVVCKTPDGIEFTVTPALEISERMNLAEQMSEVGPDLKTHFEAEYLGKMLTVYFAEYSKEKVPQQARTSMELRDPNY